MQACESKKMSFAGSGAWQVVRACALLALVTLLPGVVHAQSSIAGTIRDASGAVLPGVTVEAASAGLD